MNGERLAAAAEALVGARFRLQGRDPATGLDCVGVLAAAALAAIGRPAPLPSGYTLRSHRLPQFDACACGFAATDAPLQPGDVQLLRVGPCQHHLVIAARGDGFVHAHAGLRRVVLVPGAPAWPVVGRWRLI